MEAVPVRSWSAPSPRPPPVAARVQPRMLPAVALASRAIRSFRAGAGRSAGSGGALGDDGEIRRRRVVLRARRHGRRQPAADRGSLARRAPRRAPRRAAEQAPMRNAWDHQAWTERRAAKDRAETPEELFECVRRALDAVGLDFRPGRRSATVQERSLSVAQLQGEELGRARPSPCSRARTAPGVRPSSPPQWRARSRQAASSATSRPAGSSPRTSAYEHSRAACRCSIRRERRSGAWARASSEAGTPDDPWRRAQQAPRSPGPGSVAVSFSAPLPDAETVPSAAPRTRYRRQALAFRLNRRTGAAGRTRQRADRAPACLDGEHQPALTLIEKGRPLVPAPGSGRDVDHPDIVDPLTRLQ
jgi:hypothetical protein